MIEKYKITIKERELKINPDTGLPVFPSSAKAWHVHEHLVRLKKLVANHERLMKQREAAATAADEYLRSGLVELSKDENRSILIEGFESKLDRIEETIQKITAELHANLNEYAYTAGSFPPESRKV